MKYRGGVAAVEFPIGKKKGDGTDRQGGSK